MSNALPDVVVDWDICRTIVTEFVSTGDLREHLGDLSQVFARSDVNSGRHDVERFRRATTKSVEPRISRHRTYMIAGLM